MPEPTHGASVQALRAAHDDVEGQATAYLARRLNEIATTLEDYHTALDATRDFALTIELPTHAKEHLAHGLSLAISSVELSAMALHDTATKIQEKS